jgi:hypothetical protein
MGYAVTLLVLMSRNVHHTRRGDKYIYALPWPFRLFFVGGSFLGIAFVIDFIFGPDAAKSLDWTAYTGIAVAVIPFCLLSCYFVLYRVTTDDKAIYYAAYLTTTVPFESVTRVVERRGSMTIFSYIYSKGHLPTYISGFLPDYADLMGSIRDKTPQASWEP